MKKILIVMGISLAIGSLFAFYFFKDLDKDIKQVFSDEFLAYAFQVGVFTNYDNALESVSLYNSGRIIKDEELYRVYIAIVKDEELMYKLKEYYDKENIIYYVKRITIDNEFANSLNKYEELMKKSSDSVYDYVNKEILESYGGVLV